jgi:flagellar capping protein FliD
MASTVSSIDTQIAGLAPTLQTAIKAIVAAESTPLKRTQAQKDTIEVRRGIYTDIKSNFDGLQSAIQALISTQASYGMQLVNQTSVTPGTTGTTVLSATTSESAALADYDITVTQLAKNQSKTTSGIAVTSVDTALGKTGTFWLGGNGTSAVSLTTNDTVTASSIGTVATGQRELGTGTYTLETRIPGGMRQFRLVNADGSPVSIRNQDGSFTSEWQTMTDGSFDTGRGLKLTLSTSGTSANTAMTYTAAGTSFNITTSDTLRTITVAINAASQPVGRDFKASIVANKLVLTGAQTGENHTMLFTDGAGLGFGVDNLQDAQNAKFTVNGMAVSRAGNTNLSDVVDGATINLASDAEGKSARLSIVATSDKSAGLMSAMVNSFNKTLSHLKDKLASTAKTEGENIVYTRSPLSGDMGFRNLRFDLLSLMNRNHTNSGTFTNFAEIGLNVDAKMNLTFDSAKFSDAFKNNASDVTALLDSGLGGINSLVSSYAGTSGSLSKELTSIDEKSKNYVNRIAKYNDSLARRKETLYNLYLGYQNQIIEYGYTAQWFGILNGTSTNGTNVNTSG